MHKHWTSQEILVAVFAGAFVVWAVWELVKMLLPKAPSPATPPPGTPAAPPPKGWWARRGDSIKAWWNKPKDPKKKPSAVWEWITAGWMAQLIGGLSLAFLLYRFYTEGDETSHIVSPHFQFLLALFFFIIFPATLDREKKPTRWIIKTSIISILVCSVVFNIVAIRGLRVPFRHVSFSFLELFTTPLQEHAVGLRVRNIARNQRNVPCNEANAGLDQYLTFVPKKGQEGIVKSLPSCALLDEKAVALMGGWSRISLHGPSLFLNPVPSKLHIKNATVVNVAGLANFYEEMGKYDLAYQPK